MKKLLLLVLSMVMSASMMYADSGDCVKTISKGLAEGNVNSITPVFNKLIDISFSDNQVTTYSKAQAGAILKKFFAKSASKDFKLKHTGKSTTNNTLFGIGTLYTNSAQYRVYMFFVPGNGDYLLRELRFEKL